MGDARQADQRGERAVAMAANQRGCELVSDAGTSLRSPAHPSPFSVVIPAYNEVHGVVSVIQAVRSQNLVCELVVVDDGSTDGTAQAAEKAGATVLRHPVNGG